MKCLPIAAAAAAAGLVSAAGAAPCLAQSIAPGQPRFGALSSNDPVDHRGAHFDCHDFVGVADQSIEIVMRSLDVNPWVALHKGPGCQGDWEDSDNDSGFGFEEAKLEATLDQGGTWSFRASSADPEDTGDYMVGFAVADTVEAARLRADPQKLAMGSQVDGALSPTDAARPPGRYFDCYEVTVESPVGASIDVRSAHFVPIAHLYMDSSWRRGRSVELVVQRDPDEAGPNVFRGAGQLPRAGRYFIAVTSDGLRQTGAYQMAISATPGIEP